MKEFKGTKGEWRIFKAKKEVSIFKGDTCICIADICRDSIDNREEIEANANLIVAAPELLDIALFAYKLCNKIQYPTERELNQLKFAAYNAINKALGEQNV